MNLCKHNSWSQLYAARKQIAARFGDIFALPIVKRVRDELVRNLPERARVLEVGAGARKMKLAVEQARAGVRYESMDLDPEGEHEYRDLADAPGEYDVVFSFEVVEHLTLDEIKPWLTRLGELVAPGGKLLLTTPNTYYPPDFLRDATHRTPLCYDELGGLVETAGLRVTRIVRVYNDPFVQKLLRRYVFNWLFRLLRIDFARQIMLVAQRPQE